MAVTMVCVRPPLYLCFCISGGQAPDRELKLRGDHNDTPYVDASNASMENTHLNSNELTHLFVRLMANVCDRTHIHGKLPMSYLDHLYVACVFIVPATVQWRS